MKASVLHWSRADFMLSVHIPPKRNYYCHSFSKKSQQMLNSGAHTTANEFSGIEITEIEAKSEELIAVKSGGQNNLNHRTPKEPVHEILSLIAQILNKSIKWGSTTWLKKAKYGAYTWKERGKEVILVAQTHQSSTDSTQILTKEWKTKSDQIHFRRLIIAY